MKNGKLFVTAAENVAIGNLLKAAEKIQNCFLRGLRVTFLTLRQGFVANMKTALNLTKNVRILQKRM